MNQCGKTVMGEGVGRSMDCESDVLRNKVTENVRLSELCQWAYMKPFSAAIHEFEMGSRSCPREIARTKNRVGHDSSIL